MRVVTPAGVTTTALAGQFRADETEGMVAISPPRALAVFWIVAGVLGWIVSFLLYLEYVGQLTDVDPIVSC